MGLTFNWLLKLTWALIWTWAYLDWHLIEPRVLNWLFIAFTFHESGGKFAKILATKTNVLLT